MSNINKFHRVIIILLFVSFVFVCVGLIDTIQSLTIGNNNGIRALPWSLTFCAICFLLICKCFRWLDTLQNKECFVFTLIIFFLITGIMIASSFSARVMQFADAFDVMDTALYFRKNAKVTDNLPYIKYVGSFGNNYPVILFQSFLIKIIQWLSIDNPERVLTHFNIVIILSAIGITWLIVNEVWGMRAAAKTAFVCLLNPYFYLMINWTYSMTFSLPIMMGILYIAFRLKKNKNTIKGVALALFEGLLLGVGFMIRPTTVFPLIAAMLVWFPYVIKHRIKRKRMVQIICIIFAMVLVLAFVNVKIEKRFGSIEHMKMPLSFWLMMGSHGDGTWNEADFDAMMAIRDPKEKANYGLNQALNNYADLGIDGILNHWNKKINVAWTNGGFFYRQSSFSEGNSLSEYILENGARNQLTKIYCQAFRLLMIVGFLLACATALMKHKIPEIVLIMMITVFGCVVFHSIWETNARYSIPFILPMLVAMIYGLSSMLDYRMQKVQISNKQKTTIGFVLLGILIVVCSNLNTVLKTETTLDFYRISSTSNIRVCAEVGTDGFDELEQDFYAEKPFNTLFFKATIPAQKTKNDCSDYNLSILSDNGQILYSTILLPEHISGQGIKVPFKTISGYKHYTIRLQKIDPKKESIQFYTHYTYGVDEYRGELIVDHGEAYSSDLMMDVYETQKTTVFSDKARILVITLIMLLGGFVAFIPITKKREYYTFRLAKVFNNVRAEEY